MTSFMAGALIIGVAGATSLGLIAATTVPTQITGVEDTWRDRYGWKGDVASDVGSQETDSYALADNVTPTWLFNSASVPDDFAKSDNDRSYNDYALSPDRYDYADFSVDEPPGTMSASYNAEPQALDNGGPEAAARSANQVALEVREVETAPTDAHSAEQTANLGADEPPGVVLGAPQP
ncbi:hypothetical protein QUC32_27455 (plasmid) [Novosphingobium resinovorum]|uniref:hypothetical protein n=1 Tax=Sphingomonadaceae TaxID=41297 RepID=UPI0012EA85A2|nr:MULTISPECIES: hypothetical protein [Sphingomonadaceae]MBF7015439.1 hypothetical protein [Novosphingobium sp. HR1a]WJM30118.1 hypothetical protein QUC32_27455 [Novosphingobium resinovorum]